MPSIRSRLRNAGMHGLPGGAHRHGPYRYLPPAGYNPGNALPRTGGGGYRDRFGNEWQQGPAHGRAAAEGFSREWDVQLSPAGVRRWGRDAKQGAGGRWYLNITPNGFLSH
jgi:Novel toxin 17